MRFDRSDKQSAAFLERAAQTASSKARENSKTVFERNVRVVSNSRVQATHGLTDSRQNKHTNGTRKNGCESGHPVRNALSGMYSPSPAEGIVLLLQRLRLNCHSLRWWCGFVVGWNENSLGVIIQQLLCICIFREFCATK